jgi:ribose transport system permease protein
MTSVTYLLKKIPHRAGAIHVSLITFAVLFVGASLALDLFLDGENVRNLLAQSTTLVIAAIGQTFVLLTGGLDVSIGSIISLTTSIMTTNFPGEVRVLVAIAVAASFGLVNGVGVARLNVHPIIMTLATMGIAQGISLLVLPIPGGKIPQFVSVIGTGAVGPLPATLIWLVVVGLLSGWILYRTQFGLHLYAVGGHPHNAKMNGVRVERTIMLAYLSSSLFACAAGIYLAARLASGDPKGGASFGIESVTASALGGVHLAGGIGSIFGTIVGAGILVLINNIMSLLNISAFLQSVVKGALLLGLIITQRRKQIGL